MVNRTYAMEMERDLRKRLEQLNGHGHWRDSLKNMRSWIYAEWSLENIDDTEKQILLDLFFDLAELLLEEEQEYGC